MTTRRGFLVLTGAALAFPALPGPASAGKIDLPGEIGASAQFLTLTEALYATGLVPLLKRRGPFTVFAPKEEAFARLSPITRRHFGTPAGRADLRRVLLGHIVAGRHSALTLTGRRLRFVTLSGAPLVVDGTGSGLRVGPGHVGLAEIDASNGVIHQVNRLIV
ncbi:fasciclin domain-containing protein [Roseivivax sp. CAU 1761]